MYKYMSSFFAPKLGSLIRRSITKGALPEEMRKGGICTLFKRGDRDEVRNYRPITLLQNSYKIFMRVLAKRMLDYQDGTNKNSAEGGSERGDYGKQGALPLANPALPGGRAYVTPPGFAEC